MPSNPPPFAEPQPSQTNARNWPPHISTLPFTPHLHHTHHQILRSELTTQTSTSTPKRNAPQPTSHKGAAVRSTIILRPPRAKAKDHAISHQRRAAKQFLALVMRCRMQCTHAAAAKPPNPIFTNVADLLVPSELSARLTPSLNG